MNTIAAIEATPTIRLSELWLERWIGPVSIRFGQLAADAEFFYSDLSQIFLQSDWPTIGAVNLPGGGPAYPLSAVGARIKYELPKDASLLFAIFNGDPAPLCPNADPDTCNRYGLNFRLSDPAFMMGEFQWRRNRGKDDTGLATTLKIGGWSHLGQFADQQFTNNGMLLANPAGNGMPLMHRGNYGIYGVIDQQLYRPPGGSADTGISIFNRSAISPSDRNLVNVEIDAGIVFAGMIPQRPDDTFGASVIYSRFSNSIRAFDQEQINFGTLATPPRDYEMNLELTYASKAGPSSRCILISGIRVARGSGILTRKSRACDRSSDIEKADPPGQGHDRAGRLDRREDGRGRRRSKCEKSVIADPNDADIAPAVVPLD